MSFNNQAQALQLLNQVANIENQLRMPNMVQNQGMGMGANNLLAMMGQLKTLQDVKPNNTVGRCIWVTGIPEEYQDAYKLVNVFGNFGNVQKVVFSEKKTDGALIELDDVRGALKAVAVMNGQKFDGQAIQVSFTRIDVAHMKKDDTKSRDVRKAKQNWRFTMKESKFKKIALKRLRNLSSSIIVSNLPIEKSDQLKKFIVESGYTVKSMEGSKRPIDESKQSSEYTMSLVELASTEEAISAVANLQNSWPKKFGEMKKDRYGNARGLAFSFGTKKENADNISKVEKATPLRKSSSKMA